MRNSCSKAANWPAPAPSAGRRRAERGLSADENTAIVGGPADNGYTGAVWIFTRTSGVWSQQRGKLVGTGYVGRSSQGYSVGISADGNTAIVGGYGDSSMSETRVERDGQRQRQRSAEAGKLLTGGAAPLERVLRDGALLSTGRAARRPAMPPAGRAVRLSRWR